VTDPLYRPDELTPCPPKDLYDCLWLAWPSVDATDTCTREALLVLLAHWALETGWGHYCHCWNIGNYKHVAGDGHTYTMFRCSEIIGGKEVFFDPPSPTCMFLAYDSLRDGALAYLTHLHGRFAAAWPAIVAGDAAAFCHELKVQGYYTADEAQYTSGVVACQKQLARLIPEAPASAITVPDIVADTVQTLPDELT
jgi:hypothetical protein